MNMDFEINSPSILDVMGNTVPVQAQQERVQIESETISIENEVVHIPDESRMSSLNPVPPWRHVTTSRETTESINRVASPLLHDEGSNASIQLPSTDHQYIVDDDTSNMSLVNENSSDAVQSYPQVKLLHKSVIEERNVSPNPEEPPVKVPRIVSPKHDDDQSGDTCPICMDVWGNSGEHKLASLKCGHLFGYKCVEKWLRNQPSKDRCCPTCKTKSAMRDIRVIYARKIIAADTAEITTLQKQVETLQADKNRVELELHKTKIAHKACLQQLEVLRSQSNKTSDRQIRNTYRFALEKNIEISKDGGCRVLTYNCRTYELFVSQKSSNSLFNGYGLRKINCIDYKLGQFLYLHPKPIRDIQYSQPLDLLLTVSLDSTAKLVERGVSRASINCGLQLWSCTWDAINTNCFYVGGVGGSISRYDLRNTSSPLQRLSAPSDMSPVISLCSTQYGLLSCHLNSSWLWLSRSESMEPRALPVEGPYKSLSYDSTTNKVLISCRPGYASRSRLNLCQLKYSCGEVTCEVEDVFCGSTHAVLMSRTCFVKDGRSVWVAAHSESDSTLQLHGLDGERSMSLPASEPALDVCSFQINGDTLLTSLSENRLRIYKAVSS